jgi:hypothetical protein
MILEYFVLVVALLISATSAYYSIIGLTAIFAAAFWSIVIMGTVLELGKIAASLWLKKYWHQASWQLKYYLATAVGVLMVITSLGIFGGLSKAHLDQAVPLGDVAAEVAQLDERIQTERANIESAQRALQQMDAQVEQRLSRSDDATGAERAVQIRRQQVRERAKLQQEIATAQQTIAALNKERAPIASELRKVEAEVGPIKYVAALIYGDNPDDNLLERAVRWVIIIIVLVFDPLAIALLLAATTSLRWNTKKQQQPAAENTESAASVDHGSCSKCGTQLAHAPGIGLYCSNSQCSAVDDQSLWDLENQPTAPQPTTSRVLHSEQQPTLADLSSSWTTTSTTSMPWGFTYTMAPANSKWHDFSSLAPAPTTSVTDPEPVVQLLSPAELDKKIAVRQLVDRVKNLQLQADNEPELPLVNKFGTQFPPDPELHETFLRVDSLPSRLYKFNGRFWKEINRSEADQYRYDDQYIDFLISQLESDKYDADLLTDSERVQIAQRLKQ